MSGAPHPEPAGFDDGWMWLAGAAAAAALLVAGIWLARAVAPAEADGTRAIDWLSLAGVVGLSALAAGFARRALRERVWQQDREAARRLVDLLDVWFWQTDADHRLTLLRPPAQAADAVWQAARAVQGPLWDALACPDAAALQARLQAGAPLQDIEAAWAGAPSARPSWRLRGIPRFDARGRFLGYEGLMRPAADQSAAPDAEVSEAPLVAQPASSSAAPGKCDDPERADQEAFAYAVSHDLRAPLRVVEGFTRIVKEDYGSQLDRIGSDHLDRVLGAAARMNGMIDALLEQARLSTQPMAREPVNLSQLAALVMDELRRTSPDRQADVQIEDGLCAQGDPLLLRLVLENLLGNAWKYSSCRERAVIRLGCEQRRDPGGRSHCIYCVSDNGVGFDARYAQRLFGMFQRLHSATDYPGTGVGLASVRRIIHRHGGEIWAESEVDRGSRFFFTLEGGAPPRGESH
jgi:signal transduction histidine kinase